MATLNISITIPDNKVSELAAAVDEVFPKGDGSPRTNAERQDFIKQVLIDRLRNIYRNYKRKQAQTEASSNPLDMT